MKETNFFAVDLGATSGRTILGTLKGDKLVQRELTRFPNRIIEMTGHYYWDIYALYDEVIRGLKVVAAEHIEIASIGIDTWGVDVVFVGKDGGLLRNPYCYRDPHTDGSMEEYFKLVPKEKVYEKTGIQFMQFNTLFQLSAMRRHGDSALDAAEKILFVPDAMIYLLTGVAVCEYTILSTSQFLNPRTKRIDKDLIGAVGLTEDKFGDYVNPCDKVGHLSYEVQKMAGLGAVPVVAVAGHDTGAAVASVPARNEKFAYLSCGTWSLLGIEVKDAIINEMSIMYNFTNEGGVEGTTRFLKNICGMWIFERCRQEWTDAPDDIAQLIADSMDAPAFQCFINPDAPDFANPASMVDAIMSYCRRTGQTAPDDYRGMTRCIFESLALRYRQVMGYLKKLAPFEIETLHVIGGGSRNAHLMQFTANSVGLPVLAGPVEGTALGNIMLQAKASGCVSDMQDMRRVVANSIEMQEYMPQDADVWNRAYDRYLDVVGD